jgi:autotransporter-associated beta strand protein
LNYNVANAVAAANATTTSGDLGFRITGGSIDNTSGAAINTNASTTTGNWSNSWSFIGSNGANSDLNLGSGIVYLKSANTQVTVLNAATTLTVGGTIANDATAGRSLTKAGAGRLTVNGTNTYTGATTVNAGTLQIGNGGTTGSLSASSPITNNATLAFNRSNTITQGTNFASVIAGTGAVTKLGSGTLILNGTNTYAGATTISAGTLEVQGSVATSSSISNNASLVFNSGSAQNYANGISGTGTLTKNGIGTLTLDGTNTYTGATNVNAGTLRIAGTGAINDSSGVTLNGGQFDYNSAVAMTAPLTFTSGTLGGTNWTGSALNNLTIGTNHTISPGNSPGTAATVDQTWATGGTYRFEINSVAGSAGSDPGWDLLAGTGTLTITATSLNPFVIDLTSLDTSNNPNPVFNFDETQSYAWQIADFANPVAGFDASAFFVRATNFGNAYTGTFSVSPGTSVSGGDNTQLYVRYVAVPEPTTMAILGVGVAFLGRRIARSLAPRRSCPG